MVPVTLILVGGLLAAATVALWPWIVSFFAATVIPSLRNKASARVADSVAELITWLDTGASPVRSTVRQCIRAFQETVLGIKTEYTKTSAETATRKTETLIRMEDGKIAKTTVTDEVSYADLPEEIRLEMMRQNKAKAEMDVKAAVLQKAAETGAQQGMVLQA